MKVDLPTAPPGGVFEASCNMTEHLNGFQITLASDVRHAPHARASTAPSARAAERRAAACAGEGDGARLPGADRIEEAARDHPWRRGDRLGGGRARMAQAAPGVDGRGRRGAARLAGTRFPPPNATSAPHACTASRRSPGAPLATPPYPLPGAPAPCPWLPSSPALRAPPPILEPLARGNAMCSVVLKLGHSDVVFCRSLACTMLP